MKFRYGSGIIAGILVCSVTAVVLSGCSGMGNQTPAVSISTIRNAELTEREKDIAGLSGDMFGAMELKFGDDIKGIAIYLDEWHDGVKTGSDLILHGGVNSSMNLYISSDIQKDGEGQGLGIRWKFMESYDGTRITTGDFVSTFPEGETWKAGTSSLLGETDHKEQELSAGSEYVLAERCINFTNKDMSVVTAQETIDDKDAVEQFDYVNVLRIAVFGTEEEAEALAEEKPPLVSGTYELVDSSEIIAPRIQLDGDGTFMFEYSTLMSSIPMGNYKVVDDTLTLNRRDTGTKFVFKIRDGDLVFVKGESAEVFLPEAGAMEDGATFRLK